MCVCVCGGGGVTFHTRWVSTGGCLLFKNGLDLYLHLRICIGIYHKYLVLSLSVMICAPSGMVALYVIVYEIC